MSRVTIDGPTGALRIGGEKVFPLGLSNAPPLGGTTPGGKDGLKELADAGATFIRTGRGNWAPDSSTSSSRPSVRSSMRPPRTGSSAGCTSERFPTCPPRAAGQQASAREQMLTTIAASFKNHAGLGAYKGVDEPRNPFRGNNWIRPDGLVRAARKLKALDPNHPLVIIQAPRSTVAQLTPYRPAFDITGADIFPIAYPPGEHSDLPNRDISVVGDVTRKMVQAAGGKPVWMTLQIAWSGTVASAKKPNVVPRFPTAARPALHGLPGDHLRRPRPVVLRRPPDPDRAARRRACRLELDVLGPGAAAAARGALVDRRRARARRARAARKVTTTAKDVDLVTRRDGRFLYLLAARRGGTTSRVGFTGLPKKLDGSPIAGGQVLFEYVQEPLPPPIGAGQQVFRSVSVANGGFRDWFGPHDVHVYRFGL